jgi:outer membrane protein assembly factor BamD
MNCLKSLGLAACIFTAPLLVSMALSMTFTGCSSAPELDTSTPEGAFKLGERFEADERYEEAIAQFNTVKNKHPYSKLAAEAELHIADIHFKREEFVESQGSYQAFKEMHPSYPRIDYVTFRLAMSFYNQLPPTIDRDLTVADRAILYFDEVAQSYPKSEYVNDAKDFKHKALVMLADKVMYIADFYFIRDHYESALGRYEELLDKYPELGFNAKALYGASISAFRIKEMTKAKDYFDKLQSNFKDSSAAGKARQEIGNSI